MIDASNPDYACTPASDHRPDVRYLPCHDVPPLVSIVTPCLHTAAHISPDLAARFNDTARSLQRMSLPAWEWLIVTDASDHASADGSDHSGDGGSDQLAQVEALARSDARVRIIRQPRPLGAGGVGAARLHAAQEATADYVLRLDLGEMVEPTFVEQALWLLATQPQFDAVSAYSVLTQNTNATDATDAPDRQGTQGDEDGDPQGDPQRLWRHGFADHALAFSPANAIHPLTNPLTNVVLLRRNVYLAVAEALATAPANATPAASAHGHSAISARSASDDAVNLDFWLTLAESGSWGYTIPEFLTWSHRSPPRSPQQHAADASASGAKRKAAPALPSPSAQATQATQAQRARLAALAERFEPPTFRKLQNIEWQDVPDTPPFDNHLTPSAAKPAQATEQATEQAMNQGKRVLLVLPWFELGGADKFNLDLVRTLTARGYQFTIASTLASSDPWKAQFTACTPDLFSLPHFLGVADYPRFLRYLIASRQIDTVILANSELGYLFAPYLRAHHPHLALVDLSHAEEPWKNGGYPGMAVRIGSQLDLHVVVTEHLQRWLIAHGGDPERIRVAHANVDVHLWDPAQYDRAAIRRELGLDAQTPIILFVGRVVSPKRPLLWGQIIAQVAQRHPGFVALVVGEGELLPELRAYVDEHNVRQVRFLGAQSNEQVRRLMAASDLLLLPSRFEGLALVLYESLAMGVTPVAANIAGHPELVTPDVGVLVDVQPDELKGHGEATECDDYVAQVTALLADPARRRALQAQGRARVVTQFSLERMGDAMEAHLHTAQRLARARVGVVDLCLARDSVSRAVELERSRHVSDEIWRQLTHERQQHQETRALLAQRDAEQEAFRRQLERSRMGLRALAPQRILRATRRRLLPLGSPQFETYRRWRERLR